MSPKISIIVPVYKAQSTIRKCLDSIYNQSFTDWECILIDDGSSDGSGVICDEYAANDSRFTVCHKTNEGVSAARQDGMDFAKGEYTIHIDPDDWVERDMLYDLYEKALVTAADIVICDMYWETSNQCIELHQDVGSTDTDDLIKSIISGKLHASCCNKLIRRTLYTNNDISFPKQLSLFEDKYIMCSLLLLNPSVVFINKAYYHYQIDDNSISTGYKQSIAYDKLMMDMFCKLFNNTKNYKLVYDYFADFIVNRAFLRHDLSNSRFKFECYEYRNNLQKRKMRIFMYLSCIGYYTLSYTFFQLIRKVK